jgi:hypothetical protein
MTTNRGGAPSRARELIEDLEWMADTGESLQGAAARLQRTAAAIERSLLRNGRSDLVSRLRARDPLNPAGAHRKDHAA